MDIEKIKQIIKNLKKTVNETNELTNEQRQFLLEEIRQKEQLLEEYELPDEVREDAYYINKLNQYSFKDKDDKKILIELLNYFFSYEKSIKYSNYLFKQYKDLEQIFKYQNIEHDAFLDEGTKKIMKTLISIKEVIEQDIMQKDKEEFFSFSQGAEGGLKTQKEIDDYFLSNVQFYAKSNTVNIIFLNHALQIESIEAYPEKLELMDFMSTKKLNKIIEFMLKQGIKNKTLNFMLTINIDKKEIDGIIAERIKEEKKEYTYLIKRQVDNLLLNQVNRGVEKFVSTILSAAFYYIQEKAFKVWRGLDLVDIFIFIKKENKVSNITSLKRMKHLYEEMENVISSLSGGVDAVEDKNKQEIYTIQELFCRIDKKKCLNSTFYNLSYKKIFLTDIEYLRNYNISEKILNFINIYSQVLYKIFFLPVKQIIAKDMKSFVTSDQVKIYLLTFFTYRKNENFSVIFLTDENKIIKHEIISIGTIAGAYIYIEQIAEQALYLNSKKIILIHNHPARSAIFSDNDINLTVSAMKAFSYLGIKIIDHFLIAGNKIVSMSEKNPNYFEEDEWE